VQLSLLDRERTVASPDYRRWLIPPAALAVHLSIGRVYAFSVFKEPLVAHFDTRRGDLPAEQLAEERARGVGVL
jgi:hypothetical protein